MKIFKQIFCKHLIKKIITNDFVYDEYIDNDDLDDFPTLIEISYCTKCGKIIQISDFEELEFPFNSSNKESSIEELIEFEKITKKKIYNILKDKNNGKL